MLVSMVSAAARSVEPLIFVLCLTAYTAGCSLADLKNVSAAISWGLTACCLITHRYITVRNITQQDVTELHQEILSVFSPSDIITPDVLRGNATSLKAALTTNGGRCSLHI